MSYNSVARITECFRVQMMRGDYRLDSRTTGRLVELAEHFDGLVRNGEATLASNRRDTAALAAACHLVISERLVA
jgi:hypothetical protein